jgi:hypothetical protein
MFHCKQKAINDESGEQDDEVGDEDDHAWQGEEGRPSYLMIYYVTLKTRLTLFLLHSSFKILS